MALDVVDDKRAKNFETMDMAVSSNILAVGDRELTNCRDVTLLGESKQCRSGATTAYRIYCIFLLVIMSILSMWKWTNEADLNTVNG